MRELMMKRIVQMLGPYTEHEHKFVSMRWMPVGRWLYEQHFGESFVDSKQQKQFLKMAKLGDFTLSNLPDEDIVALFELVVRRYSTQM